jgi:hypothetical protein
LLAGWGVRHYTKCRQLGSGIAGNSHLKEAPVFQERLVSSGALAHAKSRCCKAA